MKSAVFLDRDGVINVDGHYLYKPEDFVFIEGIFDFCLAAQEAGYLLFVITNQSGIGRGYYSEADFMNLTDWMDEQFMQRGVTITKVYYCPVHPEKGLGHYRKDSYDRKPNPGMIFKAAREYDIDLEKSLLIGDKMSDIEAGSRAGIGTLLLFDDKETYQTNTFSIIRSLNDAVHYL